MSQMFKTLRGFLEGSEDPDLKPYSVFSATLRIFGRPSLDFAALTANVAVTPTRIQRQGERESQNSPPWKTDGWFFEPHVGERELLGAHLDALWFAVQPSAAFLKSLKATADVSIFCGYRSNIDHAGFEVPHRSLEIFSALELPFGVSVIIT
jgi:hypothetical protein